MCVLRNESAFHCSDKTFCLSITALSLTANYQFTKEQTSKSYCCSNSDRDPLRLNCEDGQQRCQRRCNGSYATQCYTKSLPTVRFMIRIYATCKCQATGSRAVSLTEGHQAEFKPIMLKPATDQKNTDNGHYCKVYFPVYKGNPRKHMPCAFCYEFAILAVEFCNRGKDSVLPNFF